MATREHTSDYRFDPLWQALAAMRIEADGAAITFTAKLSRETGWTHARAAAVIEEYRRFLYLAARGRKPVSPSDAVDRAWHLHLTYSRHYWDVLCAEILGRPLHHDPNPGGAAEDERHGGQYLETLDRYRSTFGSAPPADIWPDPRLVGDKRQRGKAMVALGGAAGASLLLAACTALAGNGGGGASWFFPLAVVGFLVVFLAVVIVAAVGGSKGKRSRDGSDCGGDSGCGGGDSDSSYDSGSSDGGGSSCGGGGCGGGGGD